MKVSKKQYLQFMEDVGDWVDYFGLKDWEINCEFSKQDKDEEPKRGSASFNTKARIAVITLYDNWPGDSVISRVTDLLVAKTAFHEVCEVLLGGLAILANERGCPMELINEKTHEVIRRLENTIFADSIDD